MIDAAAGLRVPPALLLSAGRRSVGLRCPSCERVGAAITWRRATSPTSSRRSRSSARTRRCRRDRGRRRRRLETSASSNGSSATTSSRSGTSSSTSRHGRAAPAHGRRGAGRRRRRLHGQARRDARPGRRVGLRQDDDSAARSSGSSSRPTGSIMFEGNDITRSSAAGAAAGTARHPDRLPGPVRLAQPAHDGRATSSASRCAIHGNFRGRERKAARRRAAADRRPEPRARQPLPARVLGRTAAAHRHRPRARAQPELRRARRAGLGARRLDPGAGDQPARDLQREFS